MLIKSGQYRWREEWSVPPGEEAVAAEGGHGAEDRQYPRRCSSDTGDERTGQEEQEGLRQAERERLEERERLRQEERERLRQEERGERFRQEERERLRQKERERLRQRWRRGKSSNRGREDPKGGTILGI